MNRYRVIKIISKSAFYLVLIVTFGIIIFPFVWMVDTSLMPASDLFLWPPRIVPSQIIWQNYIEIFKARPVAIWMMNTFIVAGGATLLSIIVSVFGAYGLSRYSFKGKRTIQMIILVARMVPGVLLVVPIFVIFRNLHLTNRPEGLIIAFSTFAMPFCVWMLKGFFDSIPVEIENAARIDGCSTIGILFRITIPLSLPGIIAVGLFSFLLAWSEYLFARILISTEENYVVSIGLSSFYGQYSIPWDQVMAAATIISIPAVVIFMILQNYLLQGLTAGALKE